MASTVARIENQAKRLTLAFVAWANENDVVVSPQNFEAWGEKYHAEEVRSLAGGDAALIRIGLTAIYTRWLNSYNVLTYVSDSGKKVKKTRHRKAGKGPGNFADVINTNVNSAARQFMLDKVRTCIRAAVDFAKKLELPLAELRKIFEEEIQ